MKPRLACLPGLLLLLGSLASISLGADDRIVVKGKLNDEPLVLAFDTGAATTVLFRSAAEQRGLRIDPPPPDTRPKLGEVALSLTQPVKLELFGQIYPAVRLNVIDHPTPIVMDIDGVLGWPDVRDHVWFLSGSTLKLTALKAVPPEAADWLKLRELMDRPQLSLELPGNNQPPAAYLGVDTGAASGVKLSPTAWTKWRQEHPKQAVSLESYFMPGAGLVIAECAWADEIEIAGLKLRGVPVTTMNPGEIANQPTGTVAKLGLAAMMRMDTVFGGKDGYAYFHPLDTPPPPYEHNRLGAVFVPADPSAPEGADDLIAHVARGSPAAQAGVQNGDVLLMIDELDVTPWRTQPDILPLWRFWKQAPGTKLHLTLRRSGRTVTVDVTLRNILGPSPQSP